MENAPQDGSPVLVGHAAEQWRCEARLSPGVGWYEFNNDPIDAWGRELFPTHWMPLPEPPAKGGMCSPASGLGGPADKPADV